MEYKKTKDIVEAAGGYVGWNEMTIRANYIFGPYFTKEIAWEIAEYICKKMELGYLKEKSHHGHETYLELLKNLKENKEEVDQIVKTYLDSQEYTNVMDSYYSHKTTDVIIEIDENGEIQNQFLPIERSLL